MIDLRTVAIIGLLSSAQHKASHISKECHVFSQTHTAQLPVRKIGNKARKSHVLTKSLYLLPNSSDGRMIGASASGAVDSGLILGR